MGKVIAAIIIILLIIGGYFLLRSNPPAAYENTNNNATTSTNPISTTTGKEARVAYTSSGFSPKTITIKKGGAVTFTNQSSGEMWVASNPHPIHTDYPGFDEKASVVNGESWSFTFDRTGSWGYHNHKNPSSMGTVVVQ